MAYAEIQDQPGWINKQAPHCLARGRLVPARYESLVRSAKAWPRAGRASRDLPISGALCGTWHCVSPGCRAAAGARPSLASCHASLAVFAPPSFHAIQKIIGFQFGRRPTIRRLGRPGPLHASLESAIPRPRQRSVECPDPQLWWAPRQLLRNARFVLSVRRVLGLFCGPVRRAPSECRRCRFVPGAVASQFAPGAVARQSLRALSSGKLGLQDIPAGPPPRGDRQDDRSK